MHYLPVINLPDTPCTLPPRTHIGDVYPATSLRQTCQIFLADLLLSDWDSDDEELLLDVRVPLQLALRANGLIPMPTHAWTHT